MESGDVPVINLCSGRGMPILGMGTAESLLEGSERVKLALVKAIEVGYRHFDTAAINQTEGSLGEAIAEALQLGIIKSRDELFITSKLWCTDAHPDRVFLALQNSLSNLKLEYLDLYLIHYPVSLSPGTVLPMDYKSVWATMEECQKLGLTKSIGVSNFSCKILEELMATATIPPAVNQVEMNPMWQQKKLRDYCKANNILVTAYSTLGGIGTFWGSNAVIDSGVLNQIALARGKSVARVSLRWVYEQGVSLLAKSYNEDRMKDNLKIFGWKLTTEDLNAISKLPQRRIAVADFLVSVDGPFKSLAEFWDNEL
ncbi:non-functional NADPH-dependent codeinone reductase 2-like [Papaver somniferum]|uniref:non-functional NADPH-dependent codeinone reductase 2-like n=1 Tax=Papaver somniferum TaxID=3469 RepID=UPI000E702787|nr:non-functional NADPH-dependent codeinone reductase 2-like [Papaver somniferum]